MQSAFAHDSRSMLDIHDSREGDKLLNSSIQPALAYEDTLESSAKMRMAAKQSETACWF